MPLKTLFYAAARTAGRILPDEGITILSYHSIDDHRSPLSVSPTLFAQQMEALAEEGCVSLTMREVGDSLAKREPFPRRAVAITFDDGFENVLTQALPILRAHRLKATVYIITGMVGRRTAWTDRGVPLPSLRVLSWEQIDQLRQAGIEIGAHSLTHGFLTQYNDTQLRDELRLPKHELEKRLGEPIGAFAYPQGDYDPRVLSAVRDAGYTTATTVDQGRAATRNNPLSLPRLLVSNNTTPGIMRAFLSPGIGPAYKLLNFGIRRLMRKPRWPRRNPGEVQSTESIPG
ncbi:MAG: polysaccharide deacetylase family protein [Chloroflexia bacterium]